MQWGKKGNHWMEWGSPVGDKPQGKIRNTMFLISGGMLSYFIPVDCIWYIHACMQASRHPGIHAYRHTYMYIIYIHTYIYVYINVCIYGLQADYTYMNYKSLTNWDAPGRNAAAQGIWTWPCRNALCQSWESRSKGRHCCLSMQKAGTMKLI